VDKVYIWFVKWLVIWLMFKTITSDIKQKQLLTRLRVVTIALLTYKTTDIKFYDKKIL